MSNPILYAKYAMMFIEVVKELKKRKAYTNSPITNYQNALSLLDFSRADKRYHGAEIMEQFSMDWEGHGING